jgi:hypothetical protein
MRRYPCRPRRAASGCRAGRQFVAAASIAETAERIRLLQTVMRLLDRAIGCSLRMGHTNAADGQRTRSRQVEQAYDQLRTRTLDEAAKLSARPRRGPRRLRGRQEGIAGSAGGPGDIAALLATIDLSPRLPATRGMRASNGTSAPVFRKYRTPMARSRSSRTRPSLEQVNDDGPAINTIAGLTKRLTAANRSFRRSPDELALGHADRQRVNWPTTPSVAARGRLGEQHRHGAARLVAAAGR